MVLTHPNRHKNYIYQKRLAHCLPMDSFRFDFRYVHSSSPLQYWKLNSARGNHESTGQSRFSNLGCDFEDLTTVIAYLTSRYGYTIDLVIAHSNGMLSAMRWLCTSADANSVRGFITFGARYRMWVSILSLRIKMNDPK